MTRRNHKRLRSKGSLFGRFRPRLQHGQRRLGSEQLEPRWVMAAVTLDTTFGNTTPPTGISISPIGPGHDAITDMKIQPWDQKVVVVGEAAIAATGSNLDFFVARYNTDGTLDTGFGAGGSIRTPIGSLIDQAAAVDFQTIGSNDKKIIVGGYYSVAHNDLRTDTVFLQAVTSDSRPFTLNDRGNILTITSNAGGFALGQYLITNVISGFAILDRPAAPAIATGGDFRLDRDVTATFEGNQDFVIVRYMPDGNIDTSFGDGGRVIIPAGFDNDVLYSLVVQPWDDKIVLVGYSGVRTDATDPSTARFDMTAVRLNSNGTLDTSFSTDGIITFPVTAGVNDFANSVTVQPTDHKIVIAGSSGNTNSDFAFARLTENGTLDVTFGGDGTVTVPISGTSTDAANKVRVQTDGSIVAIGLTSSASGGTKDVALVRLTPAGVLDTTFSTDGVLSFSIGTNDHGNGLALQTDGALEKLVITGTAFSTSSQSSIFLARLNPDGSFDGTFDTDGRLTVEPTDNQFNYGAAVDIHKDPAFPALFQKIVVAGMTRQVGPVNDQAVVMRFSNPPLSTLSVQNASVAETNDNKTKLVTVTLSSNSTQPVKVKYTTASVTATAGVDFQELSGTLTFNPGIRTAYITVPILGNIIGENDETFTLNLSDPVGATIAKGEATCTITDDDGWWMNPQQPTDVDDDGGVVALDALVVINDLNANGNGRVLPWIAPGTTGHHYLDVNSDGVVSAVDALIVINYLNDPGSGSAESSAAGPQSALIAQGLVASRTSVPAAVDVTMAALGDHAAPVTEGDEVKQSAASLSTAAEAESALPTLPSSLDESGQELEELIELIATGQS